MRCFRFIAAERAHFPISLMCGVLGVSRSGFHAWLQRAPCKRALADAALLERIRQIHAASRATYGVPRVHAELAFAGVRVGRKRVERLMRAAGLSGLVKRRRGRTTIRVPGVRCAPDLVERDFAPAAPDRLWVADISYVRTWEGWLYVAVVLDCYSRRVVGFAIGDHLRAGLVVDALEMALAVRGNRDISRLVGAIWAEIDWNADDAIGPEGGVDAPIGTEPDADEVSVRVAGGRTVPYTPRGRSFRQAGRAAAVLNAP